jgi:polyhydroxyalkanoate synthesis regulator phasin
MFDLLKKAILIGSGLAHLTTEKIDEMVQEFVKRGTLSEKEGKELAADLIERSKKIKKEFVEKVDKVIHETLQTLNLPTRKELEEIKKRLEQLENVVGKKE